MRTAAHAARTPRPSGVGATVFMLLALVLLSGFASPRAAAQSTLDPETRQKLAGAVIRSDRWNIRRAQGEEEFIGNVSYKNEGQSFTSDWALWDKAEQTFRTRGRSHATRNMPDGQVLEAWSDEGFYDFKADSGTVTSRSEPVKFRRTAPDGTQVHGLSRSGFWAGARQSMLLRGKVNLVTPQETGRSEAAEYLVLERKLALREGPPIVEFGNPEAVGALQAEKIDLFPDEGRAEAVGDVRGWVHFTEQAKP